jgi:hypothetical protein
VHIQFPAALYLALALLADLLRADGLVPGTSCGAKPSIAQQSQFSSFILNPAYSSFFFLFFGKFLWKSLEYAGMLRKMMIESKGITHAAAKLP